MIRTIFIFLTVFGFFALIGTDTVLAADAPKPTIAYEYFDHPELPKLGEEAEAAVKACDKNRLDKAIARMDEIKEDHFEVLSALHRFCVRNHRHWSDESAWKVHPPSHHSTGYPV